MNVEQRELIAQGEPSLGSIYDNKESEALNRALMDSVNPTVGFRAEKEVTQFETEFSKLAGTDYAVALNGAGTAIDLLVRRLDIRSGDEIISCSLNFPGTHLSIIGGGANLVLAEPDPKTLNLDPNDLEKRLTKKTRAVIVTYMNGISADTDSIKKVIETSPLYGQDKPKIIVDAARALGTTYKGFHVGREAWATVFSFQSKKLITTLGEGGMIATNDQTLDKALREYRSFGKNENWGSNFKMTKLQAAVGLVQLQKMERFVKLRRDLAEQRNNTISNFAEIAVPTDTDYSRHSYYLYTLVLPENLGGTKRDMLMKELKEKYGIGSVVGNPPTYKSNKLIEKVTDGQLLPRAEQLGQRIICISMHPSISAETNAYITESFVNAYGKTF